MKLLEKKLKNKSGATMLMALLFFLLCTIVATILLVASTVNSGRLSKLAQNDSRYYAVNSAAELLRDGIEGEKVTVKLKKVTDTTTVSKYTVNNKEETVKTPVSSTPGNSTYSVVMSAGDVFDEKTAAAAERGASLLTDLALDLTAGTGVVEPMSAWNFEELAASQTRNLSIENNFDSGVNVTATAQLDPDGSLIITVSSPSEGNDRYNLKLIFEADFKRVDTKSTEETYRNVNDDYIETIITRLTENRTCTVCWKLTGVERGA